jgi:hypothetical protein
MTKRHIAQVDADDDGEPEDSGLCPDCGEPMTPMSEAEIYADQLMALADILAQMEPYKQGQAIVLLMAHHLGVMVKPRKLKSVRDSMIQMMDEATTEMAEQVRAHRKMNQAERRLAMMPAASTSHN